MSFALVGPMTTISTLSDDQLLSGLHAISVSSNALLARLLEYLIEVERRGLHAKAAYSSMFDFCKRRLGLGGGATFRRLTAARLAKAFPIILERIERGEVHLEALVALRDHLTESNVVELLDAVAHKNMRQVEKLIAARFPSPDAPELIRKLPHVRGVDVPSTPDGLALERASTAMTDVISSTGDAEGRDMKSSSPLGSAEDETPPSTSPTAATESASVLIANVPTPQRTFRGSPPSRIEPLSAERHRVQLTVSTQLREKIERAQDLMRHRNPKGDLEALFEEAVSLLLQKLEKERLGKTLRPLKKSRPAKSGHVSRATRRAVFERDGERCTYVSRDGERCPATAMLEIHHKVAKALNGNEDIDNLCVRCRLHNLMEAELDFGKEYVGAKIDFRRRKSATSSTKNGQNGGGRLPSASTTSRRRQTTDAITRRARE
ncbi:MAG: hypothetical protein JST00_16410 [Deltaproteobacteria bacterium]|nr:hypothetical protein [Deltaproteobacteria bacterium]